MSKTLKVGGSMAFNIGVFGDVNLDELKKNLSPFLKLNLKILILVFMEHSMKDLNYQDGN